MKVKSNSILICLITLSFFSFNSLIAQDRNPAEKWSLSINTTYLHNPTDILFEGPIGLDNTQRIVNIENGSAIFLGVGLKKEMVNNTYREISLLGLSFQSNDELYMVQDEGSQIEEVIQGRYNRSFNLFMRFETGKNFAVDKKVVPGIAVGIEPNVLYNQMTPSTSGLFPLNVWSVGGNIMLIPKVSIRLNERLSFFGKIPFGLASFSWDRMRMDNPSVLSEEQIISNMNLDIGIGRLQFNLGLGVDI